MKNSFKIIAILVAGMFVFASCQKEGQYLPKKKITRIERTGGYFPEKEEWDWNGKLLSKITTSFDGGDVISIVSFKYDSKNRVESMIYDGISMATYYQFIYDGNQLVKIVRQEDGSESQDAYTFKREGKQVVEVTVAPVESKALADVNVLRYILPYEVAEQIKPSDAKSVMTYKLTWDGKNISHMDAYTNDVLGMEYDWTYDNMINPFNRLFTSQSLRNYNNMYSTNNVTGVIMKLQNIPGFESTSTGTYEYEYDGKYPVKCTKVTTSAVGTTESTSESVEKYYYE